MKCKKCMDNCFWYLSLELGAFLISVVFMLTSLTLSALGIKFLINMKSISQTVIAINFVLCIAHMVLFLASLTLLYGLCCEKLWPLLVFVPAVVVNAIDEMVVIIYIIINRSSFPDTVISAAAGQAFLMVCSVFAAAEIFSLYETWKENRLEEQGL